MRMKQHANLWRAHAKTTTEAAKEARAIAGDAKLSLRSALDLLVMFAESITDRYDRAAELEIEAPLWGERDAKPEPQAETRQKPAAISIIFDGPPGPEGGRFVEVETPDGKSVNIGEWELRPWGVGQFSALTITTDDIREAAQRVRKPDNLGRGRGFAGRSGS